MTEISKRFQRVTAVFTERARAVPADSWEHPAPCEGWVARDVVRHLVDWIPALLYGGPGLAVPTFPSVDEDPVGAWEAFVAVIVASLGDPDIATREFDTSPGRRRSSARSISWERRMYCCTRGTSPGRRASTKPSSPTRSVTSSTSGSSPMTNCCAGAGTTAKVAVSDDADEATELLAFIGRRP